MLPQSSHPLVASLLAFRLIHYIFPLMLAVVGISVSAISQNRHKAIAAASQAVRWTSIVGPRVITGAVFIAGLLLLVSGSLPAAEGHGVMEYLFTELLLWGHEQGYAWFNLGMAPLSGVDSHRLGPLWNRVSSLIFRHGERFYNFQGLPFGHVASVNHSFPRILLGGIRHLRISAHSIGWLICDPYNHRTDERPSFLKHPFAKFLV